MEVLKRAVISICVILLFSNISFSQTKWDGKSYGKNNIQYVENYGKPLYPNGKIKLELKKKIGGDDTIYGNDPIGDISGFAVDDNYNLYIADRKNFRVVVLKPSGEFIRTFGRKGEGPGEFLKMNRVTIDENGHLYVHDPGQNRMSALKLDGDFLFSFYTPYLANIFAIKDGKNIFFALYSFYSKKYLITQLDSTGKTINKFREKDSETNKVSLTGVSARIVINRDRLYYSLSYPYRIEQYNFAGILESVITLKRSEFKPPTSSSSNGTGTTGGKLLSQTGNFLITENGSYLVQVRFHDKPSVLDIFSPDGKYLQSIELPTEHILETTRGKNIYTFITSAENLPSISCWELN